MKKVELNWYLMMTRPCWRISLVNLPSSVSSDYPEEDILGQLDNFQKIELLSVNHELNVLTSLVEDYQLNNQLELPSTASSVWDFALESGQPLIDIASMEKRLTYQGYDYICLPTEVQYILTLQLSKSP
jgi:hypothetical protein